MPSGLLSVMRLVLTILTVCFALVTRARRAYGRSVPFPPAIVLAGGTSGRLGGLDKTALELGGVPLLDRVLAALPGPAVVVGPARPTLRPVRWIREEPAGGGPLAALAAGLAHVGDGPVLVLAADLPFLTTEALTVLVRAGAGHDGAVAVDAAGHQQDLLSCWSAARLRAALPDQLDGGRLRAVTGALDGVRVVLGGHPPPWWDCDTPQSWEQARAWSGEAGPTALR